MDSFIIHPYESQEPIKTLIFEGRLNVHLLQRSEKNENNDFFLKNQNSGIRLNIGGGSPSGSGQPGTLRPFDTFQKVAT